MANYEIILGIPNDPRYSNFAYVAVRQALWSIQADELAKIFTASETLGPISRNRTMENLSKIGEDFSEFEIQASYPLDEVELVLKLTEFAAQLAVPNNTVVFDGQSIPVEGPDSLFVQRDRLRHNVTT